MRLVEEFPDAEGFGGAPGLGIAASLGVGSVAVEDFGEVAEAAGFEEAIHAAEIGARRFGGGGGKVPGAGEGFAEDGEGPGPGGAGVLWP